MSSKQNQKENRLSPIEDLLGFDYEAHKDSRSVHHKGKYGYSNANLQRIYYIKERKEKQREDQKIDSLVNFHAKIKKNTDS
jgi:hypothetical protein